MLDSELGGKMQIGPFCKLKVALRDLRQELDEAPPTPAPAVPPPNLQPSWLAVALVVGFLCGAALEKAR